MSRRYSTRLFRKILVPVVQDAPTNTAVMVSLMIADPEHILLAGIVAIPDDQTSVRPPCLRAASAKRFRSGCSRRGSRALVAGGVFPPTVDGNPASGRGGKP